MEINETTLKVVIPLATAILGFIFSYFLQKLKEKKEPRHRLTWAATTQKSAIQAAPDIQQDVSVTYKGTPVKDLVAITCSIKNTGNRVVKNHLVRFELPKESRVLDSTLTPEPQREIGVIRDAGREAGPNEAIYIIGHLEKGKEIVVKLLGSGENAFNWAIHSFNEAGDVEFHQRDASRIKEDSEHVAPLLTYAIFMGVTFAIAAPLQHYPLVPELTFITQATTALFLAIHIRPAARALRSRLWTGESTLERGSSVIVHGGVAKLYVDNSAHNDDNKDGKPS